MKKLSAEDFFKKCKLIHGDRYDYSESNYTTTHTKIDIICRIHGKFSQAPSSHLLKRGCPKCGGSFNHNTEEFILRSKKVHGNKYDYSKCQYVNKITKVTITCPIHGEFEQPPNVHTTMQHGCPKCNSSWIPMSKETFIEKSKLIHGNKYDYSKVLYSKSKENVEIICPKHGSFWQKPNYHLLAQGCPMCCNNISKAESSFLEYVGVKDRNKRIDEWPTKPVDGIDIPNKTIYEFLGDFWHGNPEKYNSLDINKKNKKTFGDLYSSTIKTLDKLKSFGYIVKYIWENDWKKFQKGIDLVPNIKIH